jgi:DNA-binding PadR family transcriptional regulator
VPAGGRRWGRTRVTSPDHVDLLVLSTLRDGRGDVAAVVDRLRRASEGAIVAPDNAVARALRRLVRAGQVKRVTTTAKRPAYRLTTVGERVADGRARQWEAYARAVDAVVGPPRRH